MYIQNISASRTYQPAGAPPPLAKSCGASAPAAPAHWRSQTVAEGGAKPSAASLWIFCWGGGRRSWPKYYLPQILGFFSDFGYFILRKYGGSIFLIVKTFFLILTHNRGVDPLFFFRVWGRHPPPPTPPVATPKQIIMKPSVMKYQDTPFH